MDAIGDREALELIPTYLHGFKTSLFIQEFNELPEERPWDHTIEFIPGSLPEGIEDAKKVAIYRAQKLIGKVYPLARSEESELDSSSTKICAQVAFALQIHQSHLPSFLSRRKTANYARYRTTDGLIPSPDEIVILYPSLNVNPSIGRS